MSKRSIGKVYGWPVLLALAVLFASLWFTPGRVEGTAKSGQEDVAAVVKGDNAFAFDLYAKLKADDGNIVFSPYSISSALAMTYAGARGETERQMAEVLHFSLDQDRLHAAMAELTKGLNKRGGEGKYELAVANRLWGQKGMHFLPAFLDLNKKFYGAGFEAVDFAADPEKARAIINAWADEQTRGKIKEPVPKGAITSDTALALANAIYFKGKWASQFDPKNTKDAPFFVSAKEQVTVPMMFQKSDFVWGGDEGLQFVELPYVGEELSMLVLLPEDKDGLAGLEAKLSPEFLEQLLASGHKGKVQVYLPRFKLEFGAELSDVLQKMGMTDAFGNADFSGMTGAGGLSISQVIHKAMVDVNEEGTEAAAVTVVLMGKTAVELPIIFRADHPFLFLIRDHKTNSILFMGRVENPKG
jgi:serpin B